MAFSLSSKSKLRLKDTHPDIQSVVAAAIKISAVDFMVLEGVRSVDRQKELFAAGATQTMNSRHLTGHAVDLAAVVGGHVTWKAPLYNKIADAMLKAAADLGIPLVWGGSWVSFKDLDHFELNRQFYP